MKILFTLFILLKLSMAVTEEKMIAKAIKNKDGKAVVPILKKEMCGTSYLGTSQKLNDYIQIIKAKVPIGHIIFFDKYETPIENISTMLNFNDTYYFNLDKCYMVEDFQKAIQKSTTTKYLFKASFLTYHSVYQYRPLYDKFFRKLQCYPETDRISEKIPLENKFAIVNDDYTYLIFRSKQFQEILDIIGSIANFYRISMNNADFTYPYLTANYCSRMRKIHEEKLESGDDITFYEMEFQVKLREKFEMFIPTYVKTFKGNVDATIEFHKKGLETLFFLLRYKVFIKNTLADSAYLTPDLKIIPLFAFKETTEVVKFDKKYFTSAIRKFLNDNIGEENTEKLTSVNYYNFIISELFTIQIELTLESKEFHEVVEEMSKFIKKLINDKENLEALNNEFLEFLVKFLENFYKDNTDLIHGNIDKRIKQSGLGETEEPKDINDFTTQVSYIFDGIDKLVCWAVGILFAWIVVF